MENIIFYIIVAIAITIAVCKIKLFNLMLLNGKKSKSKALLLLGVWFYILLQVFIVISENLCNYIAYSHYDAENSADVCRWLMNDFKFVSLVFLILGLFSTLNSYFESFALKNLSENETVILSVGSYNNKKMQKNANAVAVILTLLVGVYCIYNGIEYVDYKLTYSDYIDYYDVYYMLQCIPSSINSALRALILVKTISIVINILTKNAITVTDKRVFGVADGGKKLDCSLSDITSVFKNNNGITVKNGYKQYNFKYIDNATLIIEELSKNIAVNAENITHIPSNEVDGIQLF